MADLTYEEIGNDISTFPDLDLTFTPITGARVVAEGVARAWLTRRKGAFWAPNMGRDLSRLTNGDLRAKTLRQWQIVLIQEARQVDGVSDVDVQIFVDDDEGLLEIRSKIKTKAGTSDLLVNIDQAANVLRVQTT